MTYCILKYSRMFKTLISRCDRIEHSLRASISCAEKLGTFNDIIAFRRTQAKRSALIEVKSEDCVDEVVKVCETYGNLRNTMFGKITHSKKMVVLVEFETSEQADELLKNCTFLVKNDLPKVCSQFLLCSKKGQTQLEELVQMGIVTAHNTPNKWEMTVENLPQDISVQEVMNSCVKLDCLTDFGSRLRFLFSNQLENSLSGFFPGCRVNLFGSSVNGFGLDNCDLDLTIDVKLSTQDRRKSFTFHPPVPNLKNSDKGLGLELISDFIRQFVPCVNKVLFIHTARVPIIKMYHTLTGLDCDLSVCNGIAFYMSELLYIFGEVDTRVRPLVFFIRKWAKCKKLTKDNPGTWLTNFQLTLLVIFFLQNRSPPVLPSLERLKELADEDDVRFADHVNCTFQRKFMKLPVSENVEDLGTLLLNFFVFYRDISLKTHVLSIVTADIYEKPDRTSLYIQNPLELDLNVSRNVHRKHAKEFQIHAASSVRELENNLSSMAVLKLLDTSGYQQLQNPVLKMSAMFENVEEDILRKPHCVGLSEDSKFMQEGDAGETLAHSDDLVTDWKSSQGVPGVALSHADSKSSQGMAVERIVSDSSPSGHFIGTRLPILSEKAKVLNWLIVKNVLEQKHRNPTNDVPILERPNSYIKTSGQSKKNTTRNHTNKILTVQSEKSTKRTGILDSEIVESVFSSQLKHSVQTKGGKLVHRKRRKQKDLYEDVWKIF